MDQNASDDIFSNKLISAKTNKNQQQPKSKSNNQRVKELKYELPGNSDVPYEQALKFGVRDDRYGLFSDNGYGELIEIKKRKIDAAPSSQKGGAR